MSTDKKPTHSLTALRFGFTLIELVIVIVILGIIAGVTLPKFMNFKTMAIEKSEDAIIGALNTAIKIYCTSYIVAGGDPTNFPAFNPFGLLQKAPPYLGTETFTENTQDNYHWRIYNIGALTSYYIFCPHWNGSYVGGTVSKGRWYIFQFGSLGIWPPYKAGDMWVFSSYGH